MDFHIWSESQDKSPIDTKGQQCLVSIIAISYIRLALYAFGKENLHMWETAVEPFKESPHH
jgi:hypothetical protein